MFPSSQLGVDPVLLGIILVLNISIGMFTPPFGFNAVIPHPVAVWRHKPSERP